MLKAATMFLLGFACVVSFSLPVFAQDVAGHYVLRGVMEVGSELTLKPDGTFEYMLAYGAADYWSKGTWKKTATRSSCAASEKRSRLSNCCAAKRESPGASACGYLARTVRE